MIASREIVSRGAMKTVDVEVHWDSGCTDTVTAINWTILEPGSTEEKTIFVRNTGNAPVTLSLTISDWDPPEAEMHISLAWDREDAVLLPGEVVPAVLGLQVSEAISGITDFFSIITVEGTG